jgi:hypothetical protein
MISWNKCTLLVILLRLTAVHGNSVLQDFLTKLNEHHSVLRRKQHPDVYGRVKPQVQIAHKHREHSRTYSLM